MDALAELTPPEIDGQLAELSAKVARAEQHVGWALDTLHSLVGDKRRRVPNARGRLVDGPWELTETEARERTGQLAAYEQTSLTRALDSLDTNRAELARLGGEIAARNDEWARRGYWSRFFLVKNNNGHIHSSMKCSTCYWNTLFAWLPALSGLTEKDAVDAHGTILCSVCFPSAPTEWTVGKVTPDGCAGSGQSPVPDPRSRPYARYGKCPECGTQQTVTQYGAIRKHKPPKTV